MFFRFIKDFSLRKIRDFLSKAEGMANPPSAVRGMTVLDRNAFERKITFPALMIPVESIKPCKKLLRNKLPKLQMKLLADSPIKDHKLLILNPGEKIDPEDVKRLNDLGIEEKLHDHEVTVGYEHYLPRDIFRAVLPLSDDDGGKSPTGFSQVGHIVHLNLREHQLPFKHLIGQVFLDKVSTARTVVHKLQNIDNEFRNFEMEVLAGDHEFITRVVEHYTRFEFDFSKVFWNPRLSTEHDRIKTMIPEDGIVFDVCAGVGPFAVPLAKKGCTVYANDLNPDSYKWLQHNARLNKVKAFHSFNMDGRNFIKDVMKKYLLNPPTSDERPIHVLMNLPAIAVEFLDAFINLFSSNRDLPDIIVHLYMFSSGVEAKDQLKSRIHRHLGKPLPLDGAIHCVRNIAPNKDQFCVSFKLPHEVLFSKSTGDEPKPKRLKEEDLSIQSL